MLDYSLADRQSDSGPGKFVTAMEPLEHHENPPMELRRHSDSVVAHRKHPLFAAPFASDMYLRRQLAAELQRIADKVLDDLAETTLASHDRRHRIVRNDGVSVLDRKLQNLEHLFDNFGEVNACACAVTARAREQQQIVDELFHPHRAIDRKVDEVVGVGVELALVALLDELHVARDHPERLLQIMRSNIGELLQLRV